MKKPAYYMELGDRRDNFTRMVVDDACRSAVFHGVKSAADYMRDWGVPFAVALRTLTRSDLPRRKSPEPPDI